MPNFFDKLLPNDRQELIVAYREDTTKLGTYGGSTEIDVIAKMLGVSIAVFEKLENGDIVNRPDFPSEEGRPQIDLLLKDGNHFNGFNRVTEEIFTVPSYGDCLYEAVLEAGRGATDESVRAKVAGYEDHKDLRQKVARTISDENIRKFFIREINEHSDLSLENTAGLKVRNKLIKLKELGLLSSRDQPSDSSVPIPGTSQGATPSVSDRTEEPGPSSGASRNPEQSSPPKPPESKKSSDSHDRSRESTRPPSAPTQRSSQPPLAASQNSAMSSFKPSESDSITMKTLKDLLRKLEEQNESEKKRNAKLPHDSIIKNEILGIDNFIRKVSYVKTRTLNDSEITDMYRKIQKVRIDSLPKPKKIIAWDPDGQGAGEEAQRAVRANNDDRVVRLARLLQSKDGDKNKLFRSVVTWLPTSSPESSNLLKERYRLVTGSELEKNIEAQFSPKNPDSLQNRYLTELMDKGKVSRPLELAHMLGLMHYDEGLSGVRKTKGVRKLDRMNKDKLGSLTGDFKKDVLGLIKENSADFAPLGYDNLDDIPEDRRDEDHETLKAIRDYLGEDSGITGEIKRKLNADRSEDVAVEQPVSRTTKNPHADALISMIFNLEESEHRKINKSELPDKILSYAQTMPSAERDKLLKAYHEIGLQQDPSRVSDPYKQFWAVMQTKFVSEERGRTPVPFLSPRRLDYIFKRLSYTDDKGDARIYELDCLLESQALKSPLTQYTERSKFKQEVLNLLSSDDTWNARKALTGYNMEDFKKKLKAAGLKAAQRDDVNRQLSLGGAAAGEKSIDPKRQMSVYQNLKKHVEKKDSKKVLKLLTSVDFDSFEYHLIRNDLKLLAAIHDNFLESHGDDPMKMHQMWDAVYTSLNLPYGVAPADISSEPLSYEDYAQSQRKKSPGQRADERKKYWAGRMAATYDNSLRTLEVAFGAQRDGVTGKDIDTVLKSRKHRDTVFYDWLENKKGTLKGSQAAHEALKNFLGDKKITPSDILNASKPLPGLKADQQAVESTVNDLSPEEVLTYWYSDSLKELKELTDARLKRQIALWDLERTESSASEERLRQRREAFASADDAVKKFSMTINKNLEDDLRKVTGTHEAAKLKRTLDDKLGQALENSTDPSLKGIRLPPGQLAEKGYELRGKSSVLKQRYLQSGVGWHHFSTDGAIAAKDMGLFLTQFTTYRDAVHLKDGKLDTTHLAESLGKEASQLQELKKRLDTLDKSQSNWQSKQDELNAEAVKILTTILSLSVTIAGLASGIAAAPAALQLVWALSTAAGQSVIKNTVQSLLSRKGDFTTKDVCREVIGDVVKAVPAFFIKSELEMGAGLRQLEALNSVGSHIRKPLVDPLFNAPKKAALNQLEGVINKMIDLPLNAALDPKSNALKQFSTDLKEQFDPRNIAIAAPGKFAASYVGALSNTLFNTVMAGNYHSTSDVEILYNEEATPGVRSKALTQMFHYLDDAAQFQGGPTDEMGASIWAGSEGADTIPWYKRMGNALKTALYEEMFRERVTDKLQEMIESAISPDGVVNDLKSVDNPETAREIRRNDPGYRDRIITKNMVSLVTDRLGISVPSEVGTFDDLMATVTDQIDDVNLQDDLKSILTSTKETLEQQWNDSIQEVRQEVEKSMKKIDTYVEVKNNDYLQDRVNKRVRDEMENLAERNGIPETESNDMASLLSWANENYREKQDDRSFNLLKEAYAVDHLNRSDDVYRWLASTDDDTVADQLLDQYIKATMTDPKVYLESRAVGRLERTTNAEGKQGLTVDVTIHSYDLPFNTLLTSLKKIKSPDSGQGIDMDLGKIRQQDLRALPDLRLRRSTPAGESHDVNARPGPTPSGPREAWGPPNDVDRNRNKGGTIGETSNNRSDSPERTGSSVRRTSGYESDHDLSGSSDRARRPDQRDDGGVRRPLSARNDSGSDTTERRRRRIKSASS